MSDLKSDLPSDEKSTVLVVDDNDFVRRALVRTLQTENYRVREAADGPGALQQVANGGIDLVMLDLVLLAEGASGMTGLDVLANLRELYSPESLPVVVVAARQNSEENAEALDLGANDILTKPIDFPLALARISGQLRHRAREVSPLVKIEPGAVLNGTYQLQEELGKGRFGAVYHAVHLKLRRDVAVKLLRTETFKSKEAHRRFEIEGISACRVRHPNAVTILDFNVTQTGMPYMVMELLVGATLADELKRVRQLSYQRCAEIALPVCEVLNEAHAQGVIHRDVKPRNVFLHQVRQGEVVKVLDFGIAKLLGDALATEVTVDGRTPGTPAYMAPERFAEMPYDGRSDVYSLGVTLYLMLTGHLPFESKTGNPIKLALMHIHEKPRPPRELRPDLPRELERVLLSALEKDFTRRPSAAILGRELRDAFRKVS